MSALSTPAAPPPEQRRVAVYFVASPLNYLAARRVALDHEAGARQVLVCYRPALAAMVQADDWDGVVHMPWPRHQPLPGPFGRVRRLLDNLHRVAEVVGPADAIHLHSPVFDTEAVNYFVHALPRLTGARTLHARILPDGVNSLRRHVLKPGRLLGMRLRRLRQLWSPLLRYTPFRGDRIGADADFVDRVYVLQGFTHAYAPARVVTLGALVTPPAAPAEVEAGDGTDAALLRGAAPGRRRALLLGQPLLGHKQITEAERKAIVRTMADWLAQRGIAEVHYKAHPREGGAGEFWQPQYQFLNMKEPLEMYLAHTHYDVVMGVCSTALLTARQIMGQQVQIVAVGAEVVRFGADALQDDLFALMDRLDIERVALPGGGA